LFFINSIDIDSIIFTGMKRSGKNKSKTFEKIYMIVKSISPGKVATYGQIAALVGPGLPARIVGYALHGLPEKTDIPWHRVINRMGKISFSPSRNNHDTLQKYLLEREGIRFNSEDIIDLQKFLWQPDE
jgi:methylated-DNA-protein-cysteine methyltransferase-like protein